METSRANTNRWRNIGFSSSKFRAPPRARPWRPAKQKEILRYHSNPVHKLPVRNYLGKGFFCWANLGIFLDSVRPEGSPMETTRAKRNRWRNLGFFPNSVRPRGLAHGNQQSKHKSLEKSCFFFSKFRAPPRARPWRPAKQKEILRYHSNPDHKLTVRNYFGKELFCWENLGIFLDSVRPKGSPMETTKAKRNRWRNLGFFPNSVRPQGLAHG
jgi:hypothetical protein